MGELGLIEEKSIPQGNLEEFISLPFNFLQNDKMIIEPAFFKLLYIWTAQRGTVQSKATKEKHTGRRIKPDKFSKKKGIYETQMASIFANAIRNELSVLGIDIPDRLVIQSYPYPKSSEGKQADIYVNLGEESRYIKKLMFQFLIYHKIII